MDKIEWWNYHKRELRSRKEIVIFGFYILLILSFLLLIISATYIFLFFFIFKLNTTINIVFVSLSFVFFFVSLFFFIALIWIPYKWSAERIYDNLYDTKINVKEFKLKKK